MAWLRSQSCRRRPCRAGPLFCTGSIQWLVHRNSCWCLALLLQSVKASLKEMFSSPLILGASFEAELLKGVHNFLNHLTKLFCVLVAFSVLSYCIKGKRRPYANRPEACATSSWQLTSPTADYVAQSVLPREFWGVSRTWYTQLPAAAQPCSFSLALNEDSSPVRKQ